MHIESNTKKSERERKRKREKEREGEIEVCKIVWPSVSAIILQQLSSYYINT